MLRTYPELRLSGDSGRISLGALAGSRPEVSQREPQQLNREGGAPATNMMGTLINGKSSFSWVAEV